MKSKQSFLVFWSSCLGNLLEHYDTALYALLSPFLAPLFFPTYDELTALILTYAIIPISMILRPIGAMAFGYIGDTYSRQQALSLSLMGMAVVTALMAFLPTYAHIGSLAPILLSIGKSLQSFFSAGEVVGGAIYLIENTDQSKKNLYSSLYSATTIGGILLASFGVSVLSFFDVVEDGWRILYLVGCSTAIIGWILRMKLTKQQEEKESRKSYIKELVKECREKQSEILAIIFVSGFSYATYMIALVMLNGFIPMISDLTKVQMISLNTLLLMIDFLLMPLFGYLADKYSSEKVMLSASIVSVLIGIPCFMLLEQASLMTVLGVRIVLVALGVCFSAPFYAWAQQLISKPLRYSILALAYACGSQLFGAPTAVIALWMFQKTGLIASASWYWIFLGFVSTCLIARKKGWQFSSVKSKLGYQSLVE